MRIVCEGDQPKSIYFARRQRTPVITAVYLDDMRDVKRLKDMYTERWDEAEIEQQNERARAEEEARETSSLVSNGTPPALSECDHLTHQRIRSVCGTTVRAGASFVKRNVLIR